MMVLVAPVFTHAVDVTSARTVCVVDTRIRRSRPVSMCPPDHWSEDQGQRQEEPAMNERSRSRLRTWRCGPRRVAAHGGSVAAAPKMSSVPDILLGWLWWMDRVRVVWPSSQSLCYQIRTFTPNNTPPNTDRRRPVHAGSREEHHHCAQPGDRVHDAGGTGAAARHLDSSCHGVRPGRLQPRDGPSTLLAELLGCRTGLDMRATPRPLGTVAVRPRREIRPSSAS